MGSTVSKTRELGPLSVRASVSPSSVNAEARTVEVVWTTGAAVQRGGYYSDPYFEELSLAPGDVRLGRLNGGAPVLDTHDSRGLGSVLGVVEPGSAKVDGKRGTATLRFARAEVDPNADVIFRKIQDGIIRNVSVGYQVNKMERVKIDNEKIPTYRAVDWEPFEISMVPIGADAAAGTRNNDRTNPCELVELVEEKTMPEPVKTENDKIQGAPSDEERAAVAKSERERVLAIQRVGRKLGVPEDKITAAIAGDATVEAFRAAAVEGYEGRASIPVGNSAPGATIVAGDDERDKWMRCAEHWMLQRAGVASMVVEGAKRQDLAMTATRDLLPQRIDPGEMRGMKMVDLARECLERSGVKTRGKTAQEIIGLALIQKRDGIGMAATGDFPVLLENVLHKTLLASYGTTPDTWTQFCMQGVVSDFRPHKRYRRGTFSRLSALNEGGEIPFKSIPDGEKQSITAGTFANRIAITRQSLVNDDMSAFSDLATMFGRAAKLSIEVDVYGLLALNAGLGPVMSDSNTLFHASHNNITTGAALGENALDLDRVAMASQKDPSGNEVLDLRPDSLVLPAGLGGLARQINNGQFSYDSSSKFQIPNKVLGLFGKIIDTPRLSGTRRYLFASPAIAPTIEVAFLDGQQQPRLEMQQSFEMDGITWRVLEDYAVGAVDFRGAITNAGV